MPKEEQKKTNPREMGEKKEPGKEEEKKDPEKKEPEKKEPGKEEEKKDPEKKDPEKKEPEKKKPEKKKEEKKKPEKKEEKKQDSQKKDERKRGNHDVPYAFRLLSSLIGAISGLITWILQKVAAGLNLAAEAIKNARKKKSPVEPEKEKSDEKEKEKEKDKEKEKEKEKEKTAEKKAEKTAETEIEMQDLSAKEQGSDGQTDSPDKKKKESDVPRWMNEMTNNRDQFVAAMLLSHGPERQKLMDAMSGRSELSDEELNQTLDHAYIGYEGAKKDGKLDTSRLAEGMDWLKDEMNQQHTIERDTFAMADAARCGMDMISRDENQKGPDSWANTHKDTRRELRGFVAMADIKKKAIEREKWLRNPANADKQMDQKEIRECARDLMLGRTVDALYHCCRRKEGEKVRSDMALRLSIPKGKDTILKDIDEQIDKRPMGSREQVSVKSMKNFMLDQKGTRQMYDNMRLDVKHRNEMKKENEKNLELENQKGEKAPEKEAEPELKPENDLMAAM